MSKRFVRAVAISEQEHAEETRRTRKDEDRLLVVTPTAHTPTSRAAGTFSLKRAPPGRLGRSPATSGVATRKRPPTLTSDNQMTRKPNLALNAEIESRGRAANGTGNN